MVTKVSLIELTDEQKEQLKPFYKQVESATTIEEYGSIIAQVGLECLEVCFLPQELAIKIVDLINSRYPKGFKKEKG